MIEAGLWPLCSGGGLLTGFKAFKLKGELGAPSWSSSSYAEKMFLHVFVQEKQPLSARVVSKNEVM